MGFIYYKEKGVRIPILDGIDTPFLPEDLYQKIIKDFNPVLPIFLFLNGKSFQVKHG